jgi:hypothetical protein
LTIKRIIDRCAARVSQVPDVGQVHTRLRWAVLFDDVFERFFDEPTQSYRAWQFTRTSFQYLSEANLPGVHSGKEHQILLRGILGSRDETATEETFQALVDEVAAKLLPLDGERRVNLGDGLYLTSAPDCPIIDVRQFSESVYCHYAEIRFTAEESLGGCG